MSDSRLYGRYFAARRSFGRTGPKSELLVSGRGDVSDLGRIYCPLVLFTCPDGVLARVTWCYAHRIRARFPAGAGGPGGASPRVPPVLHHEVGGPSVFLLRARSAKNPCDLPKRKSERSWRATFSSLNVAPGFTYRPRSRRTLRLCPVTATLPR